MERESVMKMDGLFGEARDVESVEPMAAIRLIDSAILKCSSLADKNEMRSAMARIYHVAKCASDWALDDEAEMVSIPKPLFAAVSKDAEGAEFLTSISTSENLELIKKSLSETVETPVEKNDDEPMAWGADLAAPDNAEVTDWEKS
jgi:hypothetical protein